MEDTVCGRVASGARVISGLRVHPASIARDIKSRMTNVSGFDEDFKPGNFICCLAIMSFFHIESGYYASKLISQLS